MADDRDLGTPTQPVGGPAIEIGPGSVAEAAAKGETLADLRADPDLVSRYLNGDEEVSVRFQAAIRRASDAADARAQSGPAEAAARDTDQEQPTPDPEAFERGRDLSAAIDSLEPAASPGDFRLHPPQGETLDFGLIKGVADTFFASGLAPEIGNGLWSRAVELHEQGVDKLDTVAFNLRSQSTYAQLERQLGRDGAELLYDHAAAFVDHVSEQHPHVWDWLAQSGLSTDPWAITTLANLHREQTAQKRA